MVHIIMPLYAGFRIALLASFIILGIPDAVVGIQILVEFILVQPLKLSIITTLLVMTHRCRGEPFQRLRVPDSTFFDIPLIVVSD